MTSRMKIVEGSQLVSNDPKTYDAIVYRMGSYTYAVDKYGNVLSSVTTASQTDDIPIQAAIDYCYSIGSAEAGTYGGIGVYCRW
jgi:hypothetical protein